MKYKIITLCISVMVAFTATSQSRPYKIAADTIQLFSNGANGTNLRIENNTKGQKGFLYNYDAQGNTIFKRAAVRINNDQVVIGDDTIYIPLTPGGSVNAMYNGTRLVTGTVTYSGNGLTFNATDLTYYIANVMDSSNAIDLTHDPADGIYTRYDRIVADTSGNVYIKKGVASPDPVFPTVEWWELELVTVEIGPGQTTPTNISIIPIYKENIEWAGYTNILDSNFNYTTHPYDGLYSTYIPGFVNGDSLVWSAPPGTSIKFSDITHLMIRLNLQTAFNNNTRLNAAFYQDNQQVGFEKIVTGSYGFNRLDTAWQNIIVPTGIIKHGTFQTFNKFYLTTTGSTAGSVQVDNILLQTGPGGAPATSNGLLSFAGETTPHITPKFSHYSSFYADSMWITPGFFNWQKGGVLHQESLPSDTTKFDTNCFRLVSKDSSGSAYDSLYWNPECISLQMDSLRDEIALKQDLLVSGTNIKTINGNSLLGSGNLTIAGGSGVDNDADSLGGAPATDYKLKSDSTAPTGYATQYDLTKSKDSLQTNIDTKISNITGLVTQGTNVTVTGSGTSGSPYVINAAGGDGGTALDSLRKKGQYQDSVVAYSGGTGTFSYFKEQFFNVKDYGAVGNGSTDNTAAFQNAINAAVVAGGGTIYIPYDTNTYKISGALQTSVSGSNPNSQIVFPLVTTASKPITVKFMGGTMTHTISSNAGGLNTQGVILESTITGTGEAPSVIGAAWANYSPFGNRTWINAQFENITVRTNTKSGATNIAGTMSGINGSKFMGMQTKNVKIDITSTNAATVQPTNETFGIIYPAGNNTAALTSEGFLLVGGYKYGVVVQEHLQAQTITVYNCVNAIVTDHGYHSLNIASFSAEGCITNILQRGKIDLYINSFHTEHFHTGWNTNQYDTYFEATPRSVLTTTDTTVLLTGTTIRDIHIDHFHQATPDSGTRKYFVTNDSTLVHLDKINEVDLVETIQYPSSTATHAISLLNGSKVYITLTAHTAVNFYKSFFGKEVTIYAKQDATGGRNLTVMSQPIGVNNTAGATTKINAVNTTSGWIITAEPFDTTGRQGFGTTLPQYDLHTKRASGVNGAVTIAVENTTSTGESVILMKSSTGSAAMELFNSANGNGNKFLFSTASAITEQRFTTFGNNRISFGTNTTTGFDNTRMTILGTGEVGINETTPAAPLHITKTTEQLRVAYNSTNYRKTTVGSTGNTTDSIAGTNPQYILKSTTTGASMAIQNNSASGFPGIEYVDNAGATRTFTGYENTGGNFRFNHLGTGGIAFKISGVDKLKVNNAGTITMGGYGAGTATFDASGNITSTSDERLKTNIVSYKTGLRALMNLRPISYKWNKKSGNETAHTYTGFSAQNVKANIPNGTGEMADGMLTLQDRALMATMVNAIQEQQKQIDQLKKEIKQLKKK